MKSIFLYSSKFHDSAKSEFWTLLRATNQTTAGRPILIVSSQTQKQWVLDFLRKGNTTEMPLTIEVTTLEDCLPSGPFKRWASAAKQVVMARQFETISPGVVSWQLQLDKNHVHYQTPALGVLRDFQTEMKSHLLYGETEDYFLGNPEKTVESLKKHLKDRDLFICGFWRVNPFQETLLKAAISASSHTTMHLLTNDYSPYYLPANQLKAKLPEWGLVREFSSDKKAENDRGEALIPSLFQLPCVSVEEEMAHVCNAIIEKIKRGGAWGDCLVVVPDKQRYLLPLLKRFQELEIPCRRRQKKTLKMHPIWPQINLFLEVLNTPSKLNLGRLLTLPKFQTQALSKLKTFISQFPEQPDFDQWKELTDKSDRFAADMEIQSFWITLRNAKDYFQEPCHFSKFAEWLKRLCPFFLNVTNPKISEGQKIVETALTHLTGLAGEALLSLPRCVHYLSLFSESFSVEEDVESSADGVWLVQKSESVLLQKPFVFVMGASAQFWPSFPPAPTPFPSQSDYLNWDRFIFFALSHQGTSSVVLSYTVEAGSGPSFFCKELGRYRSQEIPFFPLNGLSDAVHFESETLPAKNFEILSQPLTSILKKEFLWSPSTFEDYQACPQQFFFKHIARLEADTDVHDDVSPKAWGTLVHELLSRFFEELKRLGRSLCENADPTDYRQLLKEIAQQLLAETADDRFAWKMKRDWLLGTDKKRGLIDHFLSTEAAFLMQLKRPFYPSQIEFELTPVTLKHPDEDKTLKFKGKIDLYLEDHDHQRMVVLDYKTGKSIPTKADIGSFKHLQLPVYQLALKERFPGRVQAGAIIYQLHHEHVFTKKIVMVDESEKKESFALGQTRPFETQFGYYQDLIAHLFKLDDLLKQGFFSPDSHSVLPHMQDARAMRCPSCAYKWACRYAKRFEKDR